MQRRATLDRQAIVDIFAAAILSGLFVFIIQRLLDSQAAKKRVKCNKHALKAEIVVCGEFANEFLTLVPHVISPLYRLPTSCFETSLRELLRSGDLSQTNASNLIRFYSEVETLNRGLDDVAKLVIAQNGALSVMTNDIDVRNRNKAQKINPSSEYYKQALQAVR